MLGRFSVVEAPPIAARTLRCAITSGYNCRRGVDHREDSRVADIFVSYTSRDRDWVFWIGQELQVLGHSAHIHDWGSSAGGGVMKWMEERHRRR